MFFSTTDSSEQRACNVSRFHIRFSRQDGPILASGLVIGSLLAIASGCSSVPPSAVGPLRSPPRAGQPLPSAVQTIVLDAGHGGHDPGASHYGMREKALTLDLTRRLRDRLRAAGLNVVLTRETDQFIPLSKRPAIANRLQADLFVSIHVNANRSRRVSGIEVYYPRVSVVSSGAHWPPTVIPAEIGMPSVTVKQLLWDLVLRRTRSQSRRLATTICRSMRQGLQVPCRSVKPARFVVLREAWMPSVLVEVGYLSNQAEARRLGSAEYREAAAAAITNGITAYIGDLGAQHI